MRAIHVSRRRKDYEDRRRRQMHGEEWARAEGRLRGRPKDQKLAAMLGAGTPYSPITADSHQDFGCQPAADLYAPRDQVVG